MNYNSLASDYASQRAPNPLVLQHLVNGAKLASDSGVLEVGCGTGNYIGAIRQATGAGCWGIDPSAAMLATAAERHSDIAFAGSAAEQLDYEDRFFDLVYSVDVIHHVYDHTAFFRGARRIVRPGGRFCTVTDSAADIRGRRPLSNYFPETIEVELARYPGIDHLIELMGKAGFSQIEVEAVEFAYPLADIQSYRDKAFSCLHLISENAFARGMRRLEKDMEEGPGACVSRYTLLWATS